MREPRYSYADNIEELDRKALMRGVGLTDEEMRRPKIAVFNTLNGFNPGHIHQGPLGDAVYEAIYENGGMPVHMNGTNICDGFAVGPLALPSRDLLVNDIELMCMGHQLDGAVLIGTCDKIVPAMLMAAGRMDIPCIILTGGYMKTSVMDGKEVDFIDIAPTKSKYLNGEITKEKLDELIDCACPGGGACGMMGTANSMALMTEVIGMSLPGNATTAATSPKMMELARNCGKRIMELVDQGITPRQIITNESIENALYVCQAIGGSGNTATRFMGMNCSAGPLKDPRVRQAIAYAIDVDAVNQAVNLGYCTTAKSCISPAVMFYDDCGANEYNPEKARELLAEAGYADGLTLTISTDTRKLYDDMATIIQSQLAEVGITIKLNFYEWATYLADVYAGNTELFIIGWGSTTLDPDGMIYNCFHSSMHGQAGNISFLSDDLVDQYIIEGRSTTDTAARAEAYKKLQARLGELRPWVYVFNATQYVAVNSEKIANVCVDPVAIHRFYKVEAVK